MIVLGYVYRRGDVLSLVPPFMSVERAIENETHERDIMQKVGVAYTQVPTLASRDVVCLTDDDVKALLDKWNEDGWGLSLAPSHIPASATWRTQPCVGIRMVQDPTCQRAHQQQ